MARKRKARHVFVLLLIFVLSYWIISSFDLETEEAEPVRQTIPFEQTEPPTVFFCPRDDCNLAFVDLINSSEKIECALYDLDLPDVIKGLSKKDARLVIDNDNVIKNSSLDIVYDNSNQLSHNKFCIFDGMTVMTGSFNPTENGAFKNNNNMIIYRSGYLSQNYHDEFLELRDGKFGKGEKVTYPKINLSGALVENYFCPEDSCKSHVISALSSANSSIYFMTFSFTDNDIADMLVSKADLGLDVRGVMEKQRITMQYNVFSRLNGTNVDVVPDKNKYIMHHKVFIIDNSTVITGSYNPTASANTKNDENILIIHDSAVAKKYMEEFDEITN